MWEEAQRTGPDVTWDGVKMAILNYDLSVVAPREKEATGALDKRLTVIEDLVKAWRKPAKFFFWFMTILTSLIMSGVLTLVFDFVKWGIATHWNWTGK